MVFHTERIVRKTIKKQNQYKETYLHTDTLYSNNAITPSCAILNVLKHLLVRLHTVLLYDS